MTCKDCIHYEVCPKPYYGEKIACNDVEDRCENFKNKADFVEVKHGYWLCTYYDEESAMYEAECSVCGETIEKRLIFGKPAYCERCGAKMDGGDIDGNQH